MMSNLLIQTTGGTVLSIVVLYSLVVSIFFTFKKPLPKQLTHATWCVLFFTEWTYLVRAKYEFDFSTLQFVIGVMFLFALLLLNTTQINKKQSWDHFLVISTVFFGLLALSNIFFKTPPTVQSIIAAGISICALYGITQRNSTLKSFTIKKIGSYFSTNSTNHENKHSRYMTIGAIILLTIVGGILRITHLDNESFYHDEVYHVAAAQGYLETQTPVLWDHVNEQPTEHQYTRALPYTKMIASTFQFFGIDETSARLPGAVAGVLAIPMLFFVARKGLHSSIAITAAAMYTFYAPAIYFSRFVRGYAFLPLLLLIVAYFLLHVLEFTIHWKNTPAHIVQVFLFTLLSGGTFLIAIEFGLLSATLFPPIVLLFLIVLTVLSLKEKKYFSGRIITLGSFFVIVVLIGILNQLHVIDIINFQVIAEQGQIGFQSVQELLYSKYLFQEFYRIPFLSKLLLFIGMLTLAFRFKLKGLFFLIVPLCTLTLAMLFWQRYEDVRYIDFLQPFGVIIIASGFVTALQFVSQYLKKVFIQPNRQRFALAVAIFVLFQLIIIPSFPGQHIPLLTTVAQADWSTDEGTAIHRRAVAPKFREAFEFIKKNTQPGDGIITSSPEFGVLIYLNQPELYDIYHVPRYEYQFINLKSPNHGEVKGRELLQSGQPFWVLFDYVHLYNRELLADLKKNCSHRSSEIKNNFVYNYDISYKNRYYWPTLYYCTGE